MTRALTMLLLSLICLQGARAADNLGKAGAPPRFAGKIEVIEFFSYDCAPCLQLSPLLSEWQRSKTADITFRRVPMGSGKSEIAAAQLYYALEALDLADSFHAALFQAYRNQEINFDDENSIAAWFENQGLDSVPLMQRYRSAAVKQKAVAGRRLAADYGARRAPTVSVARNLAVLEDNQDVSELIATLSQLIEQTRNNPPPPRPRDPMMLLRPN